MIGPAVAAVLLLSPIQSQAPQIGQDVSLALGKIVTGDESGRATLKQLTEQGRLDAATVYGEILLTAPKSPDDLRNGCQILGKAAEAFPAAKHNLARCYETGVLGPADLTRAARLYTEAANAGFTPSKCALGNLLVSGRGIAADPARGVALCQEAADAGDASAQMDLASIYLTGRGVPRNPAKAKTLLEKAVAQGSANAAALLGQIYWNGDGVAKDPSAAARYWKMAYDNGRRDVSKLLGDEAYLRARAAVPPDPKAVKDAIGWYQTAIDAGAQGALRTEMEQRLEALKRMQGAAPQG